MGDEVKKISFGFSKLAKKTAIISTHLNKIKQEDDVTKVELIDCLEGKSIKLKDPIKLDQGPLIIPLTRPKENQISNQQVNSKNLVNLGIKNEFLNNPINDTSESGYEEYDKRDTTDKNEIGNKCETLDEIAEREILEELNRKKTEDDKKHVFSVPLTSNAPSGEKESTLEDYDNIPVNAFGMAMLRGMGWAPGKGIGKTEKLVDPSLPAPRPKGMGLGADKVIKPVDKKSSNEELKMIKGSYVRVLAGSEKDAYGHIEGFDDETGRLIIKLALKNVSVSLNEFMVQLVDANEFKKNSKVINVSKYEQYKDNEIKKGSSGSSSKESLREKSHNKKSVSENPPERSYNDKSKGLQKKSSSSFESEKRNIKDGRSKASSELQTSQDNTFKETSNRSSRSPSDRNRRKESPQLQSRSHKPQSAKLETSAKYHYKDLTSHDTKRSHSSDSSDSSRSYRTSNRTNISNIKSPMKGRSVDRRRSTSNSSTSTDSSGNYSRKKKNKYKKKSSSNKYRSRSRSRSPRKHKHKKSKKYS